jgi:hypothetical protein
VANEMISIRDVAEMGEGIKRCDVYLFNSRVAWIVHYEYDDTVVYFNDSLGGHLAEDKIEAIRLFREYLIEQILLGDHDKE